ncbi:MAG: glycosyltransferase, partial [Caldilineaceae bacterium]
MKVAFVAPFGLRQKTTVWARTLPLAQALREGGFEPTILIPPWDSPEDAGRCEVVGGVTLQHVRPTGGVPATVSRLLRAIAELSPDIVHIIKPRAHAGLVQWALWQQSHVRPGPLILLDADDWEQAWAPVNNYAPATARFLAWQEEWGLRHAHGITVASRWLEQRVASYAPQIPRLYLPNGVDLPPGTTRSSQSSNLAGGATPTV